MVLLKVDNLTKSFGGVEANKDVSFEIKKREIVGLIGPNGAGKTTLFNCIVGYLRPDKGTVSFNGKVITNFKPHETNKEGIARTFQTMRIMGDLTILENVMIGSFCRVDDRETTQKEAYEMLKLVGLEKVRNSYPTEFPIPIQKRIELARALATKPYLLMLDEVASGLNPKEREEIVSLLRKIHKEKELTLFVIEHVMDVVMPISKRIIVMDGGKKITEGAPKEIANDERVIKAYLGERYVKS